jgi:hypothetical protein
MSAPSRRKSRHDYPGLLHNIGYAPLARLTWRGLNRGEISDGETRIHLAGKTGTWLLCRHVIAESDPLYTPDWNNARALLRVLEPSHGLTEAQARQALLERIESHCRAQGWPAYLVAEPVGAGGYADSLTLDHPLTAFLALAKSMGSLWMRDCPARLAPLHTPIDSRSIRHCSRPFIHWSTRLWFPTGIPQNLLPALLSALPNRSTPRKT